MGMDGAWGCQDHRQLERILFSALARPRVCDNGMLSRLKSVWSHFRFFIRYTLQKMRVLQSDGKKDKYGIGLNGILKQKFYKNYYSIYNKFIATIFGLFNSPLKIFEWVYV